MAPIIIGADLNIYEHQSTYNKNMPLRCLLYLADILKPIVKGKDIYGSRLVEIPTPRFVIFYNGSENRPEVEIQKLSDAYRHGEDYALELICTVYNINPDNNNNLKNDSHVLKEYSIFIEKVREFAKQGDETPIEHAIDYSIENDILKEFLEKRKDEVLKNMTLDMTFEAREKIIRQEEYEAGEAAGRLMTLIKLIAKKVGKNKSLEAIADETEEDVEYIRPLYEAIITNPEKTPEEIYELMK